MQIGDKVNTLYGIGQIIGIERLRRSIVKVMYENGNAERMYYDDTWPLDYVEKFKALTRQERAFLVLVARSHNGSTDRGNLNSTALRVMLKQGLVCHDKHRVKLTEKGKEYLKRY